MTRETVLALVQLPPPLHGAAIVNQDVVTSRVLNARFRIVVVPVQLSTSSEDIGDRSSRKWTAVARNIVETAMAMLRHRPALVYFALPPHGGGFYANLPLVALTKLYGAPLLCHFHGKGIRAAARSALYRRLFAWALKDAHVILLSERLYDDASAFVARERAFFLPNALALAPALELPERSGRNILFLSNLFEAKGPLVLLDALALLQARRIHFQASFAGAPSRAITRDALARAVEARGLKESVRYLGAVTGEGKQDLFGRCDILAFPTCNDAFPLVVLEAMGAGLAVVATNEGAIPDMVREGETGILVPLRDPERLADALQRLLENPALCREMGRSGQAFARTAFSPEAYHWRMKEIWDRLACRRR